MKTLTISQPFPDLIRNGEKFVENRRWQCSYRGKLAIHAGKGAQYLDRDELAAYTTGAVIAIADLVACLELAKLRHQPRDLEIEGTRYTVGQILYHKHSEGPFLWVLDNVRAIEPIVATGKQGLWIWNVDPATIKYIPQAA